MDFLDKIRELSARIPKHMEHSQNRRSHENRPHYAPFISALGYNVFDPTEGHT